MELIIDTNVPLTALPETANLSNECVLKCIELLNEIDDDKHTIVIDNRYIILKQYDGNIKNLKPNLANRFLKWVFTNITNSERVKQIPVEHSNDSVFEGLPETIYDSEFDRADLVFVAVSMANDNKAPIVQAADAKWIGWEEMLTKEGVKVNFICRAELEIIYNQKMAK